MRLFICLIINIISVFFLNAQDYKWWNEKHNWDGVTSWGKYIIMSPAYMGPNALPVPIIKDGTVDDFLSFEMAAEGHFSGGDNTYDCYTSLFVPLAKERVGMFLNIVPFEYYQMDALTRDVRKSRDFDGVGSSVGDLYIGTYIQLIKNRKNIPDVMLTINLRTASGSNSSAARFTNTPGYYMDVSFGKKMLIENSSSHYIYPFGMMGFYVWQTNRDDFFQNDAFLYGCGAKYGLKKFEMESSIGGYIGYINNGDKPMVLRSSVRTIGFSAVNYKLSVQKGLHDYLYNSVRLSLLLEVQ